jgi:hypothetical protein
MSKKIDAPEYGYDPETCITAGELRALRVPVPSHIPDVAWTLRGSLQSVPESTIVEVDEDGKVHYSCEWTFIYPFHWVTVDVELEKSEEIEEEG